MVKAKIWVEVDDAPDAGDYGGWRVVLKTETLWSVQYRGDIAECEAVAEDIIAGMNVHAAPR